MQLFIERKLPFVETSATLSRLAAGTLEHVHTPFPHSKADTFRRFSDAQHQK